MGIDRQDGWGGRWGAEQVSREGRQAADTPDHGRAPQAKGPGTLSGYEVV